MCRIALAQCVSVDITNLMKIIFMSLVLSLLVSSCANQTVYLDGDLTGPPTFEEKVNFWLSGVGQEYEVNGSRICEEYLRKTGAENRQYYFNKSKRPKKNRESNTRQKLSRVEIRQSIGDVLLTILTLTIYSPRTVRIYCN
jgi:hypothetical protein